MSSVGTDEYAGAAQNSPRMLAGSAQTEPTKAEVGAMLSSSSCWGGVGAQADPLHGDLPEPLLVSQASTLGGCLAGSFDALDNALLPFSLSRECSQRSLGAQMDINTNSFADEGFLSLGSRQNSQAFLQDYVSDDNGPSAEFNSSTDMMASDDSSFCGQEEEDLRAAQRDAEASRISGEAQKVAEEVHASLADEVDSQDGVEVPEEPATPSTVGEKRGFSCFGSDTEDADEQFNSKRPRFEEREPAAEVVTLSEADFEDNLQRHFGAVKETKLDVFKRYAEFFRTMEQRGIAVATPDPEGVDNCVFGWQRLDLVDVDQFFDEVKNVVKSIIKPRDPNWDNALKNFYERMNELSIAPNGFRLRPEQGYYHRPSSTATKMRVTPKYEYNPQKANRTMKKRGWTKTRD